MRYTAAALVAAERPVVIAIGRSSHRVSRWWIRRFRTWTARPVSCAQMLALQAARRDPLRYLLVLATVLRAVFPRRWWYRLTGDPVALLLALPDALRTKVLQALFTRPASDEDATLDEDPIEQIRRAQRELVHGKGSQKDGVTLAVAAATVRAAYGDTWYYSPRWPTSDGYVPFAVVWVEYAGIQALQATQRLVIADGFAVAHAKDPMRARRSLESLAFPAEQVH